MSYVFVWVSFFWFFRSAWLCVSRAHEIEICPSSVRRLCGNYLFMHGFLLNFGCCLPWANAIFYFLTKFFFFDFLRIFIVFVYMGPYGSKIFKPLLLPQSLSNILKLLLNFLLNRPHKSTVLDFWILSFWFLTIFFFENFKFTIVAYGEV